ncbi:IPT/TIG domain-containing protein [Spirosoma koreense]
MNVNKPLLTALLFLMSLSAVIVGCKKESDSPTPTPAPVPTTSITSIDPATAPVGSTIAVNGTNFSTDPASNTITVGGVVATVVSATGTRLVVVVPSGAANGPVSVTAGGQTAQSTTTFTLAIPPLKPVKEVQGTTFANLTWKKDTIYLLRGMVYIPADYSLTIEAGTVIKGAGPDRDPAGKNMLGTLVVERRGKIIAQGTAAQPIIFTSAKPAGQRSYGDWGGVVLAGKSPINRPATTLYPAGVRGTIEAYGEPIDNSGTLSYVRIEYAGGLQPGATSRLGGLSLYGVGAGTVIDHVQVSYSGGDAFNWFGGSANVRNLVAYRAFDDDWSVDWGYVGNVQFGVALRDPDVADQSGSNGIELENYDTGVTDDVPAVVIRNGLTQNVPVFANLSNFAFGGTPSATTTAKGTGAYQAALYLRRNSAIAVYNSLFYGYPEGLRLEATSSPSGLASGQIDLKGVVLANILTPAPAAGGVTSDQTTAYFAGAGRANQLVQNADLTALLLNGSSFSLATPGFLPQTGSPLLTGAVTGGKLTSTFIQAVAFRGAFGTENWLSGWTNFNPQTTEYDR